MSALWDYWQQIVSIHYVCQDLSFEAYTLGNQCNIIYNYLTFPQYPHLYVFCHLFFIKIHQTSYFYLVETQWPILDDKMEISQMWTRLANKTEMKNAFGCVTISSCVLV